MSYNRYERLRKHFAAGGCPLDYQCVAALLDMSHHSASRLLTYLEHGARHWQAEFIRTPQRQLVNLTRKPTEEDRLREQIRQVLLRHPNTPTTRLAERFEVSGSMVKTVRRRMAADGELKSARRDRDQLGQAAPRAARRHPEDEPHLQRAARFRQLWPVATRA